MIIPFGTYITPNRLIGMAAVFCSAVSAGIMLSRSGSASTDPMPRSTVRRAIAFFDTIMVRPFYCVAAGFQPALGALKGRPYILSDPTAIVNGVLLTIAVMIDDHE